MTTAVNDLEKSPPLILKPPRHILGKPREVSTDLCEGLESRRDYGSLQLGMFPLLGKLHYGMGGMTRPYVIQASLAPSPSTKFGLMKVRQADLLLPVNPSFQILRF